MRRYIFIFLFLSTLYGEGVKSLYNRLDPASITEALAFYELYPDAPEGKQALARAQQLLQLPQEFAAVELLATFNPFSKGELFSEPQMKLIEQLGSKLPTRKLKGHFAKTEKEVLELDPCEIEIGKALLLSQFDGENEEQVSNYAAKLDLMAIQVLTKVSFDSTPEEKIKALNKFIFEENRFRYPPQSIYAKDIDLYTFLPSVMDNHLGVCLGVTTLYLALADRIGLPLEIVTPPGHIYLRYRDGEKKINIETTARGIDTPDEKYLGIQVKSLTLATRREVIGMTHVNKASTYLYKGDFEQAAKAYYKALPYMENDLLVNELLGLSLLLSGKKEEGLHFLNVVKKTAHDDATHHENVIDDYLAGFVDEEGIKVIFREVDEKKSSIVKKQQELLQMIGTYPYFRAGLEQVAVSYLQLNRFKEASLWLKKYFDLDDQNPGIAYYLAVVHGMRQDYASSWKYLKHAEKLTAARGYHPKVLKDLRKELQSISPE